jgi:hypothetical protein
MPTETTPAVCHPGYDDLWLWFELSYARFLVLPRVLMHEMPDDWQGRMAALLREYSEAFPNLPEIGCRVQCTTPDGKLRSFPDWMLNYRHPDKTEIQRARGNHA